MFVKQILSGKGSDVATVDRHQPVQEVARLLKQHGIGALLVVDGGGRVKGIISERDVAYGLASRGASLLDLPVEDVMTRDPLTCSPDDSLGRVMETMTVARCRHLPVISSGRLSGIVSIGDVVKARLQELETEAAALQQYISGGDRLGALSK